MLKRILTAFLIVILITAIMPNALAVSVTVNNKPLTEGVSIYNATTYVPLRSTAQLLNPAAKITWENSEAVVKTSDLTLTARPGNYYIAANGRMLFASDRVKLINGTTMVPVRALAKAFGATVSWDGAIHRAYVSSGSGSISSGDSFYDSESVYWLSRIIEAEGTGEPLLGKIAVGNVILNRVASSEFPNTIHDVIFDDKWGIQFTPVANGTIYNTPTSESIIAAKLCLDGASVVGNSLYFLNPQKSTNFWAVNNRAYVATIGNHAFYA